MANRVVTEMSGGEYQRVIIARALAQEPRVVLLDEVTLHLDMNHQMEILDLVHGLSREKDLAVVLVLHDLGLAARYSDHLILLQSGRIFDAGPPERVITAENIRRVYGLEAEISRSRKGNFLTVTPISSC